MRNADGRDPNVLPWHRSIAAPVVLGGAVLAAAASAAAALAWLDWAGGARALLSGPWPAAATPGVWSATAVAGLALAGWLAAWAWLHVALRRPLARTAQWLARVGAGHPDPQPPGHARGELAALAGALEALLSRLDHRAGEALQRLARGDLDAPWEGPGREGWVEASARLGGLMAGLREAAAALEGGTGRVREAGRAVARGATEHAEALAEVSTYMSELAEQTQRNAHHAAQANELGASAGREAGQGSGELETMLEAMDEVSGSGRAISRVIAIIDEVAFQTNLLALNAAVEARRAGRHGKGFAVVADEVRRLATRSAEAARESATLVERTQVQVEGGSDLARRTGASLRQVMERITDVTRLVGEIAEASRAQARDIGQVRGALEQIEQVSQNAAAHAGVVDEEAGGLSRHARTVTDLVASGRPGADAGETPVEGGPPGATVVAFAPRAPAAAAAEPGADPDAAHGPGPGAEDDDSAGIAGAAWRRHG